MAPGIVKWFDRFATEPMRVAAPLRLPLIALMALVVDMWDVDHWLPVVYVVILGLYAVVATAWLIAVLRGPLPRWSSWAPTVVDVLVVVTLCLVSGGATAALLPVFFLLPLSIAFQDRPRLTAVLGISTAVGYLAVWIVYSKRDDRIGMPNMVYVQFGFLLWLAAASTALCFVLALRKARVRSLLEVRRQLVSESARAEERQHRELAEHLHDGPLQTLLAARLELDELRERRPDPALDLVQAALQETATDMRSTVTALHPQVLAQLGLTEALRELLRQYDARAEFIVEAELEDVGRPASQALLYRAARELLNNITKHAAATVVRVELRRHCDRIVLTIVDDGTGFDLAIVNQAVAQGHIGLASLIVRLEAMGGSMGVDSSIGYGTEVTVTSPPEPVSAPLDQHDIAAN